MSESYEATTSPDLDLDEDLGEDLLSDRRNYEFSDFKIDSSSEPYERFYRSPRVKPVIGRRRRSEAKPNAKRERALGGSGQPVSR